MICIIICCIHPLSDICKHFKKFALKKFLIPINLVDRSLLLLKFLSRKEQKIQNTGQILSANDF